MDNILVGIMVRNTIHHSKIKEIHHKIIGKKKIIWSTTYLHKKSEMPFDRKTS